MQGCYKCYSKGDCFVKKINLHKEEVCTLLKNPKYKTGECPFQKEQRDITNGTLYKFNPNYTRESLKSTYKF